MELQRAWARRGGLRPDAEPTNETLAAHEKGRETAGEAGNRITERVFKRHDMPRVNDQLLGVFQLVPLHCTICCEIDLARQPCTWGQSLAVLAVSRHNDCYAPGIATFPLPLST